MKNCNTFPEFNIVSISLETESSSFPLERGAEDTWHGGAFAVGIERGASAGILLSSESVGEGVKALVIKWKHEFKQGVRFLGDALERGYGDLAWRGVEPDRDMPWYFMACEGEKTYGFGVRTGGASLCSWRADRHGITLCGDVRCGTRGVLLGKRVLRVADLVFLESEAGESPFEFAKRFVASLAKDAIFPETPVFGFNDWYYSYGRSTADSILRDSALCAELAHGLPFKPYSILDDGWEFGQQTSPWSMSNTKFPDMRKLAAQIEDLGCLPGIWYRPLLTAARLPEGRTLNASRFAFHPKCSETVLDPSIPENLELIREDAQRFKAWGYKLLKHDFSAWDFFGKWGFEMRDDISSGSWSFSDRSRTTAEIAVAFYKAIHEGADGLQIIACNAIGHLAVGSAQLSRIGDDTSGLDWRRTRKMGVNSLAFRAPQHNRFFMADADCAGVTKNIPWSLNAQWIDLLARSGTALFISADPAAVGRERKSFLKEAFANACREWPLPEPLDWFEGTCPERWRLGENIQEFNWSE